MSENDDWRARTPRAPNPWRKQLEEALADRDRRRPSVLDRYIDARCQGLDLDVNAELDRIEADLKDAHVLPLGPEPGPLITEVTILRPIGRRAPRASVAPPYVAGVTATTILATGLTSPLEDVPRETAAPTPAGGAAAPEVGEAAMPKEEAPRGVVGRTPSEEPANPRASFEDRSQPAEATLRRVLERLGFGVRALDPADTNIGPTTTRYLVQFAPEVRLAHLRARADDIGRAMSSIAAPVIANSSGDDRVSLDFRRRGLTPVSLWPALEDLPSDNTGSLVVPVGVTPGGEQVVIVLADGPHLLVAGASGSGKTVFVQSLICSLVAKIPAAALELVLVDPKATDLLLFDGLPHLAGRPIFTSSGDSLDALEALIEDEFPRRTLRLQEGRSPNVTELNHRHPELALSRIVIVVEEYADLIGQLDRKDAKRMRAVTTRIAQRARALGIHLIVVAQRPSADVITGILKANLPIRISFRLPQRVDSMTVLDRPGAEKLGGKGDLLLLEGDKLTRAQGYYATHEELLAFVTKISHHDD